MQNRLPLTFLLAASFLLGGAAAWSLVKPKQAPAPPPNIIVLHTPPAATLRGHGWELTLPAPSDGAAPDCLGHEDCTDPAYDDDDDNVISI
ncbi:MAG TPA: hypothetical protein VKB67_08445 [Rhizomicrobium sp.]|nr:hypothetical protein [Rhizomicrobium sp.]